MTPLYGLHLWIVLLVCVPLRLDAAVAYLAANISLPFVAPLLVLAEVELGAWARTGHGAGLALSHVQSDRAAVIARLATELAVGTAIFAPAMAIVGGAITFAIVARARRRRSRAASDPIAAAIDRVATRYARGRRAAYHYVRGKLASDPVARAVASLGDLGEVLDLGCGRGQLALVLLEAARATRVVGVDWDARKVDDANDAASGLDARFVAGDVRAAALAPCDTVVLADVLHYFRDAEQDAILARAADVARRRVVVRDLDPDRGWRSAVTRAQEAITTSLRFNRGERVRPRAIAAIARLLASRGFAVRVEPCWGKTPFANVLVVAERR